MRDRSIFFAAARGCRSNSRENAARALSAFGAAAHILGVTPVYMHRFFALAISLVLLTLLACGGDSEAAAASEPDPYLAAHLDSLRRDYSSGDLFGALARARHLRGYARHLPEADARAQRAELYQYLCQLHFHRSVHLDSIGFYADAAAALLPDRVEDSLRARQLLCTAYAIFDDWAFAEMLLHAHHGRRLLESAGDTTSWLFGELLVAEGRAAKQHGISLTEQGTSGPWYRSADDHIARAAAGAERWPDTWRRYVREQRYIVRFKLGGAAYPIDSLAADLRPATAGAPSFGLPERARGMWHAYFGVADSAIHYFQRILDYEEVFSQQSVREAYFWVGMINLQRARFAEAAGAGLAELYDLGCCPPAVDRSVPTYATSCGEMPNCVYLSSHLGTIYREWYAHSGDADHARVARTLALSSLDGYENSFRHHTEAAVLNKNFVLGDRLIGSALQTAVVLDGAAGESDPAEMLFQAMELGKSLLLMQELRLLQAEEVAEGISSSALRSAELERDLLLRRFLRERSLPLAALERYRTLSQTLQRAAERIRRASPDERTSRFLRLGEVRATLTEAQALLEFAETDSTLYALYADRDTTVTYTVDLRPVREKQRALLDLLTAGRPPDPGVYAGVAYDLYRLLLGPVDAVRRARAELLVVPTPALAELPFAALLTQPASPGADYADLPYLVRDHAIRYLASWRSDRRLAGKRAPASAAAPPPTLGIWTHPDLRYYFADLTAQLTQSAGNAHFMGANNQRTFLDRAGGYDWLHLSVHATGDPYRLHENYLHLAAGDSLNGLFIGRRVLPAQLVVLAACSTSRGYANRREGTYSLRRSFHRAGVPDVVGSLYDIPAAATAALLQAFYRHLETGCGPAAALARAQRAAAAGRRGWPGGWAGMVVG